jgi:hypothetical protein
MPTGKWDPAAGNLIGMDSECGNMSAVAAKPDEDMIVAGVALHGLWASRDGGDTYEQLGTGKGSDPIVNRASWFIFDPDHTNTFWESGIYNSGGVYRTDDDGVTLNAVCVTTTSSASISRTPTGTPSSREATRDRRSCGSRPTPERRGCPSARGSRPTTSAASSRSS